MERRLREMGIPEGAAVADDTGTNSKSLYICTYKCNSRSFHARYDISAIGLSDLSSILKSKSQLKIDKLELLRKLASVEGKDVPYDMGCCLFGSQILLAGGRKPEDPEQDDTSLYELDAGTQIYLFEADDNEKTKAKVYNHGNRFGSFPPPQSHSHGGGIIKGDCCYGELHQGKPQPLVVEVAGKLFVLSSGPVDFPSPAFEEFNSNKGIWTTLPDPPPYTGDCRDFSYAIVGTKIMVSTPISSVFCFDADAPNPGQWSVCCAEPFPFEGRMSDLIRCRRAVTTTPSSEPLAQPVSVVTAPVLMEQDHVLAGPGGSQAAASSSSSVVQPLSARRRHRPATTTDTTSTDGTGASGAPPAKRNTRGPCQQLKTAKVTRVTNSRTSIRYDERHRAAPTADLGNANLDPVAKVARKSGQGSFLVAHQLSPIPRPNRKLKPEPERQSCGVAIRDFFHHVIGHVRAEHGEFETDTSLVPRG
ncbi:PREDICTED: uncharacterized protein LOC103339835 [Prunus mume]|uniref:Uncharacterized protein LOC103339835 n=1 Tax=Prunus mume TaxID=102107 RepID=A0ABM0PLP7_PRUMU|nr:PREDICTED: uncharacterized protein LOC103339835 [Prunus mume]